MVLSRNSSCEGVNEGNHAILPAFHALVGCRYQSQPPLDLTHTHGLYVTCHFMTTNLCTPMHTCTQLRWQWQARWLQIPKLPRRYALNVSALSLRVRWAPLMPKA